MITAGVRARGTELSSSSTEVGSIERVATVQFDPKGDVIFVLSCSEGTARFQINYSVVWLQSPGLRVILGKNPYFKEAADLASSEAITGSPPLEILLVDDDPKALAVILRILHLQYEWVPVSLTEDRLYQIAILCDKYDMRRVLGTYLDKWLKPYLGEEVEVPEQAGKWLFMAYAFALPTLFTSCSKQLIIDTCIEGFDEDNTGIPFRYYIYKDSTKVYLDENIPYKVGT